MTVLDTSKDRPTYSTLQKWQVISYPREGDHLTEGHKQFILIVSCYDKSCEKESKMCFMKAFETHFKTEEDGKVEEERKNNMVWEVMIVANTNGA